MSNTDKNKNTFEPKKSGKKFDLDKWVFEQKKRILEENPNKDVVFFDEVFFVWEKDNESEDE